MHYINQKNLLFVFIAAIVFTSCVPKQKLLYLQEQKKDEVVNEYVNIRPIKTIESFDNIFINVNSTDERTARIFGGEQTAMSRDYLSLVSYTVDKDGFIFFPFVGQIHVKGLTLKEAQEKIEAEVGQYLSNISVSVKFVNNNITVLGEVRVPGQYAFFEDQVSVFQAVGFAAGFSDYGDKTNVILIREQDDMVRYFYLDLTDKNIVASEYYYLIPNDVLVVKPINARFRSLRVLNWPLILSTITTFVTVYLLLYNN
jgi:polysaccharide export outer membrane protein